MSAHPPPIPPEQKNPRGGSVAPERTSGKQADHDNRLQRNLSEQGRQGNVKQNTTNQGYQQDR
jgi:hypothetical protein